MNDEYLTFDYLRPLLREWGVEMLYRDSVELISIIAFHNKIQESDLERVFKPIIDHGMLYMRNDKRKRLSSKDVCHAIRELSPELLDIPMFQEDAYREGIKISLTSLANETINFPHFYPHNYLNFIPELFPENKLDMYKFFIESLIIPNEVYSELIRNYFKILEDHFNRKDIENLDWSSRIDLEKQFREEGREEDKIKYQDLIERMIRIENFIELSSDIAFSLKETNVEENDELYMLFEEKLDKLRVQQGEKFDKLYEDPFKSKVHKQRKMKQSKKEKKRKRKK